MVRLLRHRVLETEAKTQLRVTRIGLLLDLTPNGGSVAGTVLVVNDIDQQPMAKAVRAGDAAISSAFKRAPLTAG